MYNEDNYEINIFFKKTLIRILSHFYYLIKLSQGRVNVFMHVVTVSRKRRIAFASVSIWKRIKGPRDLLCKISAVCQGSLFTASLLPFEAAQFSYIRKTAIEIFIERLLRSVYALSAYIDVHPIVVKRSIVDAAKKGFNIWMCHTEQQLSGGRVVGVLCFSGAR